MLCADGLAAWFWGLIRGCLCWWVRRTGWAAFVFQTEVRWSPSDDVCLLCVTLGVGVRVAWLGRMDCGMGMLRDCDLEPEDRVEGLGR